MQIKKQAPRTCEKQESLKDSSQAGNLNSTPLEQLLALVQVRWPWPVMGDLEYQDWRSVLQNYQIDELTTALNHLLIHPPKITMSDGTVQDYHGRPTIGDIVRLAENGRREANRQKAACAVVAEMAELSRRKAAGEVFYGEKDLRGLLAQEDCRMSQPDAKTGHHAAGSAEKSGVT